MGESTFKKRFKQRVTAQLVGMPLVIVDLDPTVNWSKPDTIFLAPLRWATIEFKVSKDADRQPNQPYYVELMDEMSFSAFCYPEIEEEVLFALVDFLKEGWEEWKDAMEQS